MPNFNTPQKSKERKKKEKKIRDLETFCDKLHNTDTSQYQECSLDASRCRKIETALIIY